MGVESGLERPFHVAIYSGLLDAPEIVRTCGETPDAFFRKPDDLDRLVEWLVEAKEAARGEAAV